MQKRKLDLRQPVKSHFDWAATMRTCAVCGEKSGRIDDTGVCAPCRGPVAPPAPKAAPAKRKPATRRTGGKPGPKPKPKPLGPTRPQGRLPNDRDRVDERAVVDAYVAGATAPTLAAEHGCTRKRIVGILDRHGVPRRDDRAGHSGGGNRRTDDPDLIAQVRTLYLDEQRSQPEVARITGVSQATVGRLIGTTRSRSGYQHEMTGQADHTELAEALHTCAATVILSGYASPLYDEDLYADWHRHEISAWTGQGRAEHNLADGRRTEVLWSNRPLAAEQHLFGGDHQ